MTSLQFPQSFDIYRYHPTHKIFNFPGRMVYISASWSRFFLQKLMVILLVFYSVHAKKTNHQNGVKTSVFLSPKFELKPGSVSNKNYLNIDFPRGHIAIKSFDAEIVNKEGHPVPLSENYLHHWLVLKYYQSKLNQSNPILVNISGVCNDFIIQHFGLGSETRRTKTYVPDPYGIEAGNPIEIPAGYEEKWLLNVHAIDTRGVEDKLGCIECRCDLYNVTVGQDGLPLPENYRGGLRCCYDETRCKMKEGFKGWNLTFYLRYTVRYMEWNKYWIVPVRIYILDVTDIVTKKNSNGMTTYRHDCQVEYDVGTCSGSNSSCIDTRSVSLSLTKGGDLVYGVGHLHVGGISTSLYGEGGREICSSYPIYGKGKEVGNEAGYVVGMTTCYPKPKSIKISAGENMSFVSKYGSSSARGHSGVMGQFYFLLAD